MTTWVARLLSTFLGTGDDRTPVGINVSVGAVAIVVAAFLADRIPATDLQWRCALVAVAIAMFAAFTIDPLALGAVIVAAWLIMNGFLVNRLGDLSWHGTADVDRFLVLTASGAAGLLLGAVARRMHEARGQWQMGAEVQEMQVQEMKTDINEETKRRA